MSGVIYTVLLVLNSNTQMRISGYLGLITITLMIGSYSNAQQQQQLFKVLVTPAHENESAIC